VTDRDFVVFGQPDIREEDIEEVVDTLRSLWIGTGPRTHRFEERFAAYVGAPHAVGTSSCTAALHLALVAMGVGPGDEVVVPSLTFASTANVVVHAGATPVFCDVDPATGTVTPETVAPATTERTKAVIPVPLAGYPVDVEALRATIGDRQIALIVDAAHAIETTVRGRRLGDVGDASAYSFYVTKNITTAEGGMLTTSDAALAERVRVLSLHGLSADAWSRYSDARTRTYETLEPGYKYNLTDLQSALGLSQLARIDASLDRRKAIWSRYDEAFGDLPLELPSLPDQAFGTSAMHLYSPRLDTEEVPFDRDEVRDRLWAEGVGTGIHFTALHLHPYYQKRYDHRVGIFPNAEHISTRTFSLPLSSGLRDDQVDHVIRAVRSVLEGKDRMPGHQRD
jgi:dTDP-4-amino-4,6-dideoxygalactose transaminase